MTFKGHIENGQVVLDEPISLPDGTPVEVGAIEARSRPSLADQFQHIIGKAPELPVDMAQQHDHYLYGTPKE